MDIYKYPTITLSQNEYSLAKVLMVVGQTGSGKSTLLNALINYHMGIQINDSFRYMIINEESSLS